MIKNSVQMGKEIGKYNQAVLEALGHGCLRNALFPTPDRLIDEAWARQAYPLKILDNVKARQAELVEEVFNLRIGRSNATELEFLGECTALLRLYYEKMWAVEVDNFSRLHRFAPFHFFLFLAVYLKNLSTGEIKGGKIIIMQRGNEIALL